MTRTAWLSILFVSFAGSLSLFSTPSSAADASPKTASVWISGQGIYHATLDLESGKLSSPQLAAEGSAGFVALHPKGTHLYSLSRLDDGQGGVAAFAVSKDASTLTLVNKEPIGDGGASHLAVDHSGQCLFTAQYSGGSVAAFPIASDGKLLPRSALIEHQGSGPNKERQESPHPHWVGTDHDNRFLFSPDLGTDRVEIYRIYPDTARIAPHGSGVCPPGSGPRHMKFHANRKFAYVLNELHLSVTVFRYDAEAGTLTPVQTISTLPEEMREVPSSGSEIRIHPSGRFLYTGNRGHDSIAAFAINTSTGRLKFIEREPIRGSWPRNFNLDPTGRWLLAAGARSNTVSVFRIDTSTGELVFSGQVVNCPSPTCVEFQIVD